MRKISLPLILAILVTFSACCKENEESSSEASYIPEESSSIESNQQQEPLYFESDSVVDKFFSDYNAIAEIEIPAEEIETGNIRTKALPYIDDLSLEVINANDFLSISMSSSVENESTALYALFRDSIRAMRADTTDEEIESTWNAIHEPGYLSDDYVLNDIDITYIPSKELSWGTSDLRIDLEIPLN